MRQGEKRQTRIIVLLIAIIVLLLLFLGYTFFIKPAINGYVIEKQSQAVEQVLTLMILQVQQQGFTQITNSQLNQTMILVPFVPQEQQTEQQVQQTQEVQ